MLLSLLAAALLSLPASEAASIGCPCDPSSLWLDVVLVVESTESVRKEGVEQIENFLATTFYRTRVGGRGLRVGVVSYADTALKVANLSAFASTDDFMNNMHVPFLGGGRNDAESGIRAAIEILYEEGRDDVRKVIVLIASSLDSVRTDPFEVAEDFREDGGVLVTIEFVKNHGAVVPSLHRLASEGYNLTTAAETLHSDDLLKAFCDANCYCPPNHSPLESGPRRTPNGGCYLPSTLPANRLLAARTCDQLHEGAHLPFVHDNATNEFMFAQYKWADVKLWLGATIENGSFHWDDGEDMASSSPPFRPPIRRLSDAAATSCVFAVQTARAQVEWVSDDCTDDNLYVCQSAPYSTANRALVRSHSIGRRINNRLMTSKSGY